MSFDPILATVQTATVQKALAMAHNSARFGSKEARSGGISDEAKYVQAILNRAHTALRTWANFEALDARLTPKSDTHSSVNWLALGARSAQPLAGSGVTTKPIAAFAAPLTRIWRLWPRSMQGD